MKFMKVFHVAFLATAVVFGFSACGDDEPEPELGKTENGNGDNEGGNGNVDQPSGEGAVEAPSLAGMGVLFPVTSISDQWSDVCCTFNYANGRMVGGTLYSIPFTFYSNPLRIVEEYSSGNGEYERTTYYNMKANSSGFITYAEYKYEEAEYKGTRLEEWAVTGTSSITYDSEGHIVKQVYSMTEDEDTEEGEVTFVWNEGNMIKNTDRYSWNNVEEEDSGEEINTKTFTYLQERPNSGIYLPEMFYVVGEEYLSYAGLLGKPSKNIPTSYVERYQYVGMEDVSEYSYDIEVEYNANGSVAKLSINLFGHEVDRYVFGYETTKAVSTPAANVKKTVIGNRAKRMHERIMNRRNGK